MTQTAQWIKRVVVSVLAGMGHCFFFGAASTAGYAQQTQEAIAQKVLRFHVVANSNSSYDQQVKRQVRDALLLQLKAIEKECSGKEEMIRQVEQETGLLQQTALEVLQKTAVSYGASIDVGVQDFPLKTYGNVTLPAGPYDAVTVKLGKAEGENFWCVLYPPLCRTEEGQEVLSEEELAHLLSQGEYSMITDKSGPAVFRLKIVDWWQEQWAGR